MLQIWVPTEQDLHAVHDASHADVAIDPQTIAHHVLLLDAIHLIQPTSHLLCDPHECARESSEENRNCWRTVLFFIDSGFEHIHDYNLTKALTM
jgi:hypothetical protein